MENVVWGCAVVNLRPGDRILVRLPHVPTAHEAAQITEWVGRWAEGRHPVLVLTDGASLEVWREGSDGGETTDADGVEEAGGEPGQAGAERE